MKISSPGCLDTVFARRKGDAKARGGAGCRKGRIIELGWTFFLIGVPAVVLAGISKGGFGSGAAFIATPIFALILPPAMAVGIMLPLLMVIDVATLKPYWRRWDGAETRRVLLGAIPGTALGAAFWTVANPDLLRLLIGGIAVGFVVFQLSRRGRPALGAGAEVSARFGVLAGVAAGFTSFVSHAGGPPLAVYLLARGHSKTTYQATTVLVFWIVNIAKAVPYAFLGMFTVQSLTAGLYLVPAALFGTWLGVVAHRAIPERAFFAVTYALLLGAGSKLIFDALT